MEPSAPLMLSTCHVLSSNFFLSDDLLYLAIVQMNGQMDI